MELTWFESDKTGKMDWFGVLLFNIISATQKIICVGSHLDPLAVPPAMIAAILANEQSLQPAQEWLPKYWFYRGF